MKRRTLFVAALAALALPAQRADWTRPFEAHRIAGDLYYVGTYDLACFLVATPEGHILINTGLEDSAPLIRASIESLGFRYADLKILLTMQAHYDHVAALAAVARETGAEVWATEADAQLIESGGKGDYLDGIPGFEPVKVARRLAGGETIRLGGVELKLVPMPGHTRGSAGYSVRTGDMNVVIANMASINAGTRMTGPNPSYPGIAGDYERTFAVQKTLPVDVWVAGHASQYGLHDKYKPGQPYDPRRFVDPEGYRAAVERYEGLYREYLAAEAAALR